MSERFVVVVVVVRFVVSVVFGLPKVGCALRGRGFVLFGLAGSSFFPRSFPSAPPSSPGWWIFAYFFTLILLLLIVPLGALEHFYPKAIH